MFVSTDSTLRVSVSGVGLICAADGFVFISSLQFKRIEFKTHTLTHTHILHMSCEYFDCVQLNFRLSIRFRFHSDIFHDSSIVINGIFNAHFLSAH